MPPRKRKRGKKIGSIHQAEKSTAGSDGIWTYNPVSVSRGEPVEIFPGGDVDIGVATKIQLGEYYKIMHDTQGVGIKWSPDESFKSTIRPFLLDGKIRFEFKEVERVTFSPKVFTFPVFNYLQSFFPN
ncbi:OLC1v1002922C1 [Oldenlandia corymbosa var. corymbosa]|uniref:OLC1v1002922C1 n=1 Tax=Oldenlandia corymbosa var. corymbosa TaxID=529605 RepID=A0AAV1D9N1_OLDCO|nr:OLC1v1002922C1 [Oldenlandia corymbosa var. corymbosa]